MKKRIFCIFISVLLLAPCSIHSAVLDSEPEASRGRVAPNLVLITLDTTRADHLGCYGAAFASTPNIDALARAGTRFDHALSPVPLTLPSHASMLTGLVPRRHGIRNNFMFRLDESIPLLTDRLHKAGYSTAAFVSAAILDRTVGLNRGFDIYDDTVRIGDKTDFNYEERSASQVTDAALASVRDLKSPFFLWIHYFDPHLKYIPPEPYRSRFQGRPYDGEIAFMDHEIGRLMGSVGKKAGSLLVVVAGDHGESLGEHGEPAHDVFLYSATQRVPLIMSGQGIPAGRVIKRNVGLIDISPTILELLGLPPLAGIDGRSLRPLFNGTEDSPPDYEMESYYPFFAYGWAPLQSLVRKDLKYIKAPRPELYDTGQDPGEKNNLISTQTQVARELSRTLEKIFINDSPSPESTDPALLELRQRVESLGYVSGRKFGGKEGTIDPKDGIPWINDLDAARHELQLGNPRKSIPILEKLLVKNPNNLPALFALAQSCLATGDFNRAITIARKAVSISPDYGLAHFNLANALAEKGMKYPEARSEARSEYEKVLSLHSRHAEVYLSYANMLVSEGNPKDAYKVLERARGAGISDPEIETMAGLMELANGLPGPAKDSLNRAIELNPNDPKALEALGRIASSEGDFPGAAEYYERALQSAPSAALAKALGSIRLLKLGDREGARQAFQKALELTPPGGPDANELKKILKSLDNR